MRRKFILSAVIALVVIFSASVLGQSNPAEEHRIMQPITVNDQAAMGVLVVKNGTPETHTCNSPQRYITQNRSESGWACLEQSTGMWLMNAEPPAYANAEPPAVIYSEPNTIYVPSYGYSYGYPYPYSYFGYPYLWGPALGFGFGFNFGHGFHDGHGFHGRHGFGHGGFHGGGGFTHVGPAFGHGGGFHGGGFHGGGHR